MPNCSVIGCGIRKKENQKSLSLHRKKWLEAIGTENISSNVNDIFICSLHFPVSALNTTLDVTRLRDGAIPNGNQSHRKPSTGQGESNLQKEIKQVENILKKTPLAEKVLNLPSTGQGEFNLQKENKQVQNIPKKSPLAEKVLNLKRTQIKKLEQKCDTLKRKIRTLNEKVRRQRKKIANFKTIIKDLQEFFL